MKEKVLFNYCHRCGKRLKNDEYREIGFGKTCLEKVQQEGERRRLFYIAKGFDRYYKEKENGKQ